MAASALFTSHDGQLLELDPTTSKADSIITLEIRHANQLPMTLPSSPGGISPFSLQLAGQYFPQAPSITTSIATLSDLDADSRRPSEVSVDVTTSPLMEALRKSVAEPFHRLGITLGKEQGGDGTDESFVRKKTTRSQRTSVCLEPAELEPLVAVTTKTGYQKTIDDCLPTEPISKQPSNATMSKKEGDRAMVTVKEYTHTTSPDPRRTSSKKKARVIWLYDKQGELQPLFDPLDVDRTAVAQTLREIKKIDGEDDTLLQALTTVPEMRNLTDSQVLFKIKTTFHHEVKRKMGEVILPQMDRRSPMVMSDGTLFANYSLLSWQFKPRSSSSKSFADNSDDSQSVSSVAIYQGPPRVLELGCSDGNWCFKLKRQKPSWIIEGIDDADQWSVVHEGLSPRDFMLAGDHTNKSRLDYFHNLPVQQDGPQFTVRDINQLRGHEKPIPQNVYDLIRGRDIFDRVENYKAFLDEVRVILQPSGVVEFLEIDPRPRFGIGTRREKDNRHKSGPITDWTDIIADRFKELIDDGIATKVPGWSGRVTKRLEARIRPQDPIAASNLKSWLENAGFHDVKEQVWCIPVGGDSRSGRLLQDLFLKQIEEENTIPQLKESLPEVEIEELISGQYHINLHIVTGRKAHCPRAGDLLLDGSRQEMSEFIYEAMNREKMSVDTHWTRQVSDTSLEKLVDGLATIPGSPDVIHTPV